MGYWEPLGFATEDEAYDTKGDNGDGVYTMYEKNDRFDDTLQIPTQIFYGEEDAVMAWAMRTPNAQPGRPDFVNPGVFRMFQFYREYYALGECMNEMMQKGISYRDGDFSTHVFNNEDNVPILCYEIVKGVGHIQNEAEVRRAYAYFKGFQMDSEDNISYTGVSMIPA